MKLIEDYFYFKEYKIYFSIIDNGSENGILCIHGKGMHSGYTYRIVNKDNYDYSFFSFDLPGWGKSSGERGYVDSFDIYYELINYFITAKITSYKVRNLFLLGQSMGALLVNNFVHKYKIDIIKGLIFAPGIFDIKQLNNPFIKLFVNLFNIIKPEMKSITKKHVSSYTNDIEMQEILSRDPLWERSISIRSIYQLGRAVKYMYKNISKYELPILILQGKQDEFDKNKKSIVFLEKKKEKYKHDKIVIFEKSKHWLFGSQEIETIKKFLALWLDLLSNLQD